MVVIQSAYLGKICLCSRDGSIYVLELLLNPFFPNRQKSTWMILYDQAIRNHRPCETWQPMNSNIFAMQTRILGFQSLVSFIFQIGQQLLPVFLPAFLAGLIGCLSLASLRRGLGSIWVKLRIWKNGSHVGHGDIKYGWLRPFNQSNLAIVLQRYQENSWIFCGKIHENLRLPPQYHAPLKQGPFSGLMKGQWGYP